MGSGNAFVMGDGHYGKITHRIVADIRAVYTNIIIVLINRCPSCFEGQRQYFMFFFLSKLPK